MRQTNSVTRRHLLWTVLVGVAGLATAMSTKVFSKVGSDGISADSHDIALRTLISALGPIDAIGQAYLARYPDEASVQGLRLELFGPKVPFREEALRAHINAAEHDDFVAGRLINVQGWLLSRTSARVAAMASLIENGPTA